MAVMRVGCLATILCVACSSGPQTADRRDRSAPSEDPREARTFTEERSLAVATPEEQREFRTLWELYRSGDSRWPAERDRFVARNEACAYLVAGHVLRHYYRVNVQRARYPKQLRAVQDEIVAIGLPCAPYLVDLMILDEIPAPPVPGQERGSPFHPDDILRRDCVRMLGAMGGAALPSILKGTRRRDLSPKSRRLLAAALAATGDARARDPIEKMLRGDPSWEVRAGAADALGKLGDPRAAPALRRAAREDADAYVRTRASQALSRLAGLGS
jgi:hypothetical protein